MERRTQFESKLGTDQIDDVTAEGTTGGLQETPGIVGEMNDPVHLVDQNARRRHLLDSLAMQRRLVDRGGRT